MTDHVFVVESGEYAEESNVDLVASSLDAALAALKARFSSSPVTWSPAQQRYEDVWSVSVTGEIPAGTGRIQRWPRRFTTYYEITRWPVTTGSANPDVNATA